jgi:hypothetical protein
MFGGAGQRPAASGGYDDRPSGSGGVMIPRRSASVRVSDG